MGSFTNTVYTNTIDSLIQATNDKIKNPYYKFSDKKPTPVTYYKQNMKKSTLDPASKLQYAHVSSQSALRYNKIVNFVLYGIDKISLNYDVGDNGLEAEPISGDAIILPNTIEPTDGDFFSIPYLKEDLLFKVDSVTPDSLDTGAVLYKIEYHLELTQASSQIEEQVVDTYQFIVENVGTEYNCFMTSDQYSFAQSLENLMEDLANYFTGIFYSTKVQTYVFLKDGITHMYDPYMIEFIRRNKLLGSDVYVAHQTTMPVSFSFDYTRSFFYGIEQNDLKCIASGNTVTADLITDINSLFTSRLEHYYQINYVDNQPYKTRFNALSKELISGIKNNTSYKSTDKKAIYNPIIGMLNGSTSYISDSIVDMIKKLDYSNSQEMFYLIPLYIYAIKSYLSSMLSTNNTTTN